MIAETINAITGLVKALTAAFRKPVPTDVVSTEKDYEAPVDEDTGDLTRLENSILKRRTEKRKNQ